MDGFKNVEITNFRGIEHLKIDDFSRVNVLLGHNNSGKSSVLEALMLLMGMSNPDMPQRINGFRTNNMFGGFGDVRYLFYNLDINNRPEIKSEMYDYVKRHLTLKMTYTFDSNSQNETVDGSLPKSETKVFFNTLEMAFNINEGTIQRDFRSSVSINSSGMITNKNIAEGYVEKNSAAFLSANLAVNNLIWDLSELVKRKMKDVVLKRLALFDSRINAIEVINNDVFIGFEGIGELLPLSMTGDGLRRYLSVVAATANPMNNIILIDEIDNGLHYTAYRKLWESIFMLAVSTNKQVFITTHSKETLIQLQQMLEEHAEYHDVFSMYTIEKTKLKGHKAYRYGYEGLASACENDVELRSIAL